MKREHKLTSVVFIILVIACLFVIFPVGWMISTSLKTLGESFSVPPTFIPKKITSEAFVNIMEDYPFPTFFKNSLIIVCVSTVLTLAFASLAGFGVSRFRFRGKGVFLAFTVTTQMFPFIILLIPYFHVLKMYGLINKHLGIILAYMSFQTPLSTWLMYGYFQSIPKELDAAASIDGLGKFRTFLQIIFPLSLPGVAATGIYAFVNSWNEFLFAMVLTTTDNMKTVSVGIGQLIGETKIQWNDMMAASILASVPLLLVFLFLQRYFFSGLTAGSVKQ